MSLQNLGEISSTFKTILGEISDGDNAFKILGNTIGKTISDKKFASALKSMGATSDDIAEALEGKGLNDESIMDIIDALADSSTFIDNLNDSFLGLGQTVRNTFTGLGSAIKGFFLSPLGKITLAIAGVVTAIQILDAAIVSPAEAMEKMNESYSAYESAQQEIASINTELKTAKSRMFELNSKGGLTFVEQGELEKLRAAVELLEIQKDLAEKNAADAERETAASIVDAYRKNFNDEISKAATDAYKSNFGLGDSAILSADLLTDETNISSMIAGIKQFTELRDNATDNEAWLSYNSTIQDATASVWDQVTVLTDYQSKLESLDYSTLTADQKQALKDIKDSIGYIYQELDPNTWKQWRIDDLFNSSDFAQTKDRLVELAKASDNVGISAEDIPKSLAIAAKAAGIEIQALVDAINSAAGIIDYQAVKNELIGSFKDGAANKYSASWQAEKGEFSSWIGSLSEDDLGRVYEISLKYDTSEFSPQDWQDALESLRETASEDLELPDISKEKAAFESVTAAINEAKSATGLTAATAKSLKDRYSELKEFNPEALFQNTASGIRMNTTYLAQLEKLMEATNQSKFAEGIAQLTDEYNDLIAKRAEYLAKGKEDEWDSEVKSLEEKIDAARQLQAEYTGLTNSYNDWLNAQSAPQSGDWHDAASERIKTLDELYKEGLYGNTELQEGLEFFTGIDIAGISDWEGRMNAVKAAYAQLKEPIDGTTHSLRDMMATGKQGGQAYLETLQQLGYATYDAAKGAWTFSDNFDVSKIAGAMSTTKEFVEMMNELLREYGFNIDTNQAQMDTEEIQQKLNTLRETIDSLNAKTLKPNADTAEIEKAIEDVKELIASLQESGTADQISEFAQTLANLDIPTLEGLGFNFDGIDTSSIDSITKAIETQLPEIEVPVTTSKETSDKDSQVEGSVKYEPDFSGITEGPTIPGTVNYEPDFSACSGAPTLTGTVVYSASFSGGGSSINGGHGGGGGTFAFGTAHASGTAKANGDWGTAPGGKTLVGELGTEIVVNPHTGRWYTVGDYGAEFVDMPKDAIVFNHRQTESLLSQGSIVGRGKALAGGNARVMVPKLDKDDSVRLGSVSNQRTEIAISNGGTLNSSTGSNGGSGGGGNGDSGGDKERFDWIEILVERIERSIDNLAKIAESSFKALTKKLTASDDQIAKITEEIAIQEQARDLYRAEAEEIELEDYQKWRARDGFLKISDYDKDTQEKLQEYKDWYDKSLEAEDKILELRETLAELYQDQFDYIQDDFDNQIEQIEHIVTSYENGIDAIEERGLLGSANYYSALQNITQQNITLLNNELEQLTAAFDKAMASGEIEEGSQAWYEMKSSINDVREELDDANLSLLEYDNSIRQLNWDNFDYMLERIGRIANESEFLIDLMSNEKLFEDDGKFTEFADATTGLHAMNYNVYMSQADKYAEEIAKLNKEIAEDPYNTKLITRREELLDLQHDSILAAEDEKQAIIDLVEEGIDLELDALQELIDKYTDALDSAKDLYEYNNQINDQTSEISMLRKQLMANENNTSEEGRAKAQSIRAELKEAEKALEETEYDKYIDDQKEMLDDLYTEYEEILNERLDNTDALIEEAITNTNLNTESINQTITDAAADVGYTLTEGMQEIWNSSIDNLDGTIAIYGDGFSEKLTSINSVLDAIEDYVSAILAQSDAEAAKIINAKSAEGNVKFKSGGLADFTGLAQLDGTPQKPELVLNANDTQNFLELNDLLRSMASKGIQLGSFQNFGVDAVSHAVGFTDLSAAIASIRSQPINTSTTFGDINITIPIDHVDDYNDFVNQLRDDRKFEEMIKGMTIGAITGESSLAKYKNMW